jgi:hypothetical protein
MTGLIIKPANLDGDDGGRAILVGFLDLQSSIDNLKHEWYQRRAGFSAVKIRNMVRDLVAGDRMPAIVLGMRGEAFDAREDGSVILHDPTYIIDGLQRWTAAVIAAEEGAEARLAVQLYFKTDEEFEIALFRKLNSSHTSIAPSILIRNERQQSRIAATLFGLSNNDPHFALLNRVCWDQRQEPEVHLINGATLLNTLMALHTHVLHVQHATKVLNILSALDSKIDLVGLQQARDNLIHFFDVIDEIWGIRNATTKSGLIYLRQGWLTTFAKLFSDFTEFWKDVDNKELFVPASLRRDLKRIDPRDAELVRLSGGNSTARELLYQMFVQRLNKGKVNRLIDRYQKQAIKEAAE